MGGRTRKAGTWGWNRRASPIARCSRGSKAGDASTWTRMSLMAMARTRSPSTLPQRLADEFRKVRLAANLLTDLLRAPVPGEAMLLGQVFRIDNVAGRRRPADQDRVRRILLRPQRG